MKKSANLKQKYLDNYLLENYPNLIKTNPHIKGIQLAKEISKLSFWCHDDTLHKRDSDYQHTATCCLTHVVGLPRHSKTNEEMPLTPYQVDLANNVIHGREKFGDKTAQLRKALKIHIKKGRQMGFTEIILRLIQYLCFSRYKGHKVGIIAGNNGSLARKDLHRFSMLFNSIRDVVSQWIKNSVLKLVNGVIVEAFSASEEALTGDTKYKCIFMDEAAKWKLVDDLPVFNSIIPIVRTNGADLFLVSTPKGPVKMFYKIDMTHDETDFVFLVYDITLTIDNLYTKKEVDELLASSTEDPDQEYNCKYSIGRDSIFGTVTKEDQHGMEEWETEIERGNDPSVGDSDDDDDSDNNNNNNLLKEWA